MKCPDCGTEMTHGEAGPGLPYEDCPTCNAWWIDDEGEPVNDERRLRLDEYAEALRDLADLVDDLTPAGEAAYRQQERLCRELHEELFNDQAALFDLPGDELGAGDPKARPA